MMVLQYDLIVYSLQGKYPHPNEIFRGSTQIKDNTTSKFDMQVAHGVFNETVLRQVMQPDSVYVATLRQPFSQFRSFFYFRYRQREFQKVQQEFNRTVRNSKYDAKTDKLIMKGHQHFENAMFNYFHMNTEKALLNSTYFKNCLEHLAGSFHMVITEYYDESLLLLKDELCWDIKDIIYIAHKNASFIGKDRSPETYGTIYQLHRNISHLDYALYEYFLQLHRQRVKQAGEEFQHKLMLYQRMKATASSFCWVIFSELAKTRQYPIIKKILSKTKLIIGGIVFKSFTISAKECVVLSLCEPDMKRAQLAMNYPISCFKKVSKIIPDEQFCIGNYANNTDMFHYHNLHFPLSNLHKLLQCDLQLFYN